MDRDVGWDVWRSGSFSRAGIIDEPLLTPTSSQPERIGGSIRPSGYFPNLSSPTRAYKSDRSPKGGMCLPFGVVTSMANELVVR